MVNGGYTSGVNELDGKTAVITGAASGIGLEMARRFGDKGMNLVLADVEPAALSAAGDELSDRGSDVLEVVVDVRNYDEIKSLEAAATQRFGNVHLLCNNAGVGTAGAVADPTNIEAWRWTIDVDLWGVIYGCKAFLPAMVAHGEPCHVVNTASLAGLVCAPFVGAYNIAKYGVVALSETLSREMQITNANVGVSVLCPGFVVTAIADSNRNMPADIAATLPRTPSESSPFQEQMGAAVANGIEVELVGEAVVAAVENNEFWILTHEESRAWVTKRADEIANGINPSPSTATL